MNIILLEISRAIGIVIGGCIGLSIIIISIVGIFIIGMFVFDLVDILRTWVYKKVTGKEF